MSYAYRDDLTSADAAFNVEAESEEELFKNAVDAVLGLMIRHPSRLSGEVIRNVRFQPGSSEDLLHQTLEWVVYFKDAQGLLLRLKKIDFERQEAVFAGEGIPEGPERIGTDVKGITWHAFSCQCVDHHWRATVVVDI